MDSFKLLIETHLKANKLEKEIRKTRGKLIKAYKNKHPSELYTLNISYTGFANELNKEIATFNTVLNDLDKINFINNDYIIHAELMDNINDSSSSSSPSPSISEEQQEITTFYNESINNSPVITDKLQSKPKNEQPELELLNNSVPVSDNYTLEQTSQTESVIVTENQIANEIEIENEIERKHESVAVNNNTQMDSVSVKSFSENYKPTKISKIRLGYKYGGKGFDVFTNYKNKCQPIYSSTLLFCNETCNENKNKLTQFLIEYGKFNENMIEEIIFKQRGYYERYALVKVRAKLSYIKKKIKNIQKAKGNNILRLFKPSQIMRASDWQYMNNILYVNNFDILNKNTHRNFTKLFSKYGELVKDIKMGKDKNRDPFAIVHFREVEDAQKCIESELMFDGKVLKIQFSKF